jgi:hypothetical protein
LSLEEQLQALSSNLDKFTDEERAKFLILVLDKIEIDGSEKTKRGSGNYGIKVIC